MKAQYLFLNSKDSSFAKKNFAALELNAHMSRAGGKIEVKSSSSSSLSSTTTEESEKNFK